MLKLLVSISFIAFFGFLGVSQTTEQKVKDFLGDSRYQELKSSNPGFISFLLVKTEEGFRISEANDAKKNSYEKINSVFYKKQEISIEDLLNDLHHESFNILNYSFPNHNSNNTTHYLLGNSTTLLTIYSNSVLNNKVASER